MNAVGVTAGVPQHGTAGWAQLGVGKGRQAAVGGHSLWLGSAQNPAIAGAWLAEMQVPNAARFS